ncbi:hypothetical protein H7J77_11700 [Mycolicibacillus parakoreensis]|uniref:DUF3800 domain-containing protein n=1 Tax=Mycolicibacillus parakoreensis TaxID=1069221 RepID=A0ABY3U4B3_9MYCO|nr:hypothetical protein [Mycolicibacillus parakoreensis]MCV7316201.1 hypothetical protein [Mycolicibacillus parakoreensis]ULN54789.1 hypothetical protein MIU77_18850 [Mycolicibacillus parakoreensis]
MPAVELFVDESCRTDYLLCAAVVPVADIAMARKFMRELKPKNRARLHMKSESRHRSQLLARFVQAPPIDQAHIFVGQLRGTRRTQREARTQCLEALACYAADNGVSRILIESCSQDKQDRTAVVGALAAKAATARVRVTIDRPTSHELLWAADLVAWAYGAGGTARKAIQHLVTVHNLPLA